MKNIISCLLIVATFAISTPSKAIVGIASDSEATALAGLVLMDISQIWVAERRTSTRYGRRGWRRTTYVTYRVITFPAFFIAGLVLLDDQGRTEISSDLTAEQIANAELSDSEVSAFKAEIEEINAIKDVVASEISTIEEDEARMKEAGKLWTEYSSVLSNDAAIALAKLSNIE
ncbi:MAG: hypothetical protein NXH75_04820 [Halobacteriovoraceae bacterium]|nr:hypothetical protein [Halobacteriovoraceae bacterium]